MLNEKQLLERIEILLGLLREARQWRSKQYPYHYYIDYEDVNLWARIDKQLMHKP